VQPSYSWNGCGWVAAYNAATILGIHTNPADIIRYFEISGVILNGYLGVLPITIDHYFNEWRFSDINTNFTNLTRAVDDMVRNSDVSIINYIHSAAMNI
jgi:hypothetical protein